MHGKTLFERSSRTCPQAGFGRDGYGQQAAWRGPATRSSITLTTSAEDSLPLAPFLTGLAGGDNKALAERLMHTERRLTALEGLAREVNEAARHTDSVSCDLRGKFNA
jgi:hypothetical protein